MKKILHGSEARQKLLAGIEKVADAVSATLGPQGRNAIIHVGWGQVPNSTRDGVTVAKSIDLEDALENAGAQLIKNVASKTAEIAGDGTTTATVLARYMVQAGIKAIDSGANPVALKREILSAAQMVADELSKAAKPVHGERIEHVATISANNDPELGKLIAQAVRLAGSHGIITVEDSNSFETKLETAEGMRLASGWASPYFASDKAKMEFRAEDCNVLIFERKLGNLTPGLMKALGECAKRMKPFLILAESVEGDFLNTLVANRLGNSEKGYPQLPWCAVRIPQGSSRDFLHDIAAVAGGTAITEDRGMDEKEIPLEFMGQVKSVRVTKQQTILTGYGRSTAVEERIASIRTQLESSTDQIERDRLQERLAKLTGGVSMIRVGAATEVELREKKARIEDAIHATKAAIEDGVLPGGGLALFQARSAISNLSGIGGSTIVFQACNEPFRKITENAGESPVAMLGKLSDKKPGIGWNALTGKFENLIEAGVLDPVKVTRTALLNAASVAAMVLLTETLIVDVEEPTALVAAR